MFYREAGQFKSSYAADQQIFPDPPGPDQAASAAVPFHSIPFPFHCPFRCPFLVPSIIHSIIVADLPTASGLAVATLAAVLHYLATDNGQWIRPRRHHRLG